MLHHKKCKVCNILKPVTDFHYCKSGKYKVRAYCKKCKPNLPHWKENKRKNKPTEETNRKNLLKKYGLTIDGYNSMLVSQNGVCAICLKKPEKNLVVDHCHESGNVRSLLCGKCNTGLGLFLDSPQLLMIASSYLLKFKKND